jgi:hypothetical protein
MYVLAKDNVVQTYPYGPDVLRRDNPQTSFPDVMDDANLATWDVYPVTPTTQPTYDYITQNCVEVNPVYTDGVWTQQWSVTPATPEEIAQRDADAKQSNKSQAEYLLQQTDWSQMPDVDLVNKADFTAYRAEVRAIALNPPVTVSEWPVKPDEIWV